jgi:hypothetical protein
MKGVTQAGHGGYNGRTMALVLIILGLILWLAGIAPIVGIICLVIGLVLLLATPGPYGVRGRWY